MTPEDLGFDSRRLHRIGDVGRRYVDDGKLPCSVVALVRGDDEVYRDVYGLADIERDRQVQDDTVFRIYSMTKPITSIALLQLVEQGKVLLENPVARFIPSFRTTPIWVDEHTTRRPDRPIRVIDVLRHTSGLTYGFMRTHPVDALYREHGLGDFTPPQASLEEVTDLLATLPLLFSPGERWNYSMSTDVCARIVEVVSGQTFGEYLRDHVLGPLAMDETAFWARPDQHNRLAANYGVAVGGLEMIDDPATSPLREAPLFESGGGGLVSTIDDYLRFCRCLLRGGELDGERVIGRKTLEYATRNHLPDARTLNEMGQSTFSETTQEGMGFGLGFSVLVDAAANAAVSSDGEFAWGGAASTAFWVDPAENVAVVFMTQQMPSNHYPIRRLLKNTVYQAMT